MSGEMRSFDKQFMSLQQHFFYSVDYFVGRDKVDFKLPAHDLFVPCTGFRLKGC